MYTSAPSTTLFLFPGALKIEVRVKFAAQNLLGSVAVPHRNTRQGLFDSEQSAPMAIFCVADHVRQGHMKNSRGTYHMHHPSAMRCVVILRNGLGSPLSASCQNAIEGLTNPNNHSPLQDEPLTYGLCDRSR